MSGSTASSVSGIGLTVISALNMILGSICRMDENVIAVRVETTPNSPAVGGIRDRGSTVTSG
ncbi:MAG: hypothetical protein U5J63_02065 [Fodinibius sp.]|nr:hypothetical protein [Fodinibius sp.]